LTNLDQTTPTGKKKRTIDNQSVKDSSHREKATTQSYGCKMRVLFGYDKGIPCATITSSKEEIDNQFWYPKRSRVIKEYKDIKDNYSWSSENDREVVDTELTKNAPSPRIYDLRTPLKESKRTDTPEIVLLYDSPTEFGKRTKGSLKTIKATTTSRRDTSFTAQKLETKPSHELSLVDLILMEENSRSKCTKVGESYCYKSVQ
jgi:hypothetical protein